MYKSQASKDYHGLQIKEQLGQCKDVTETKIKGYGKKNKHLRVLKKRHSYWQIYHKGDREFIFRQKSFTSSDPKGGCLGFPHTSVILSNCHKEVRKIINPTSIKKNDCIYWSTQIGKKTFHETRFRSSQGKSLLS